MLLKVILSITAAITYADKQVHRVIDGEDVHHSVYPYVVLLLRRYSRMCTGSLVTSKWVLTAAHCIHSSKASRIRYGDTTAPYKAAQYSKVIKHVEYDGSQIDKFSATFTNDIGLLMVEEVRLPEYGNVSAVDYRTMTGLPATILGYGLTFYNSRDHYTQEQLVAERFKPLQRGDAVVASCKSNAKQTVCIAATCSNRNFQIYNGDSGGPLLVNGRIVGVARSIKVGFVNSYTPVSPYLYWLHDVIGKEGGLQKP